jgi:hypothetical protein
VREFPVQSVRVCQRRWIVYDHGIEPGGLIISLEPDKIRLHNLMAGDLTGANGGLSLCYRSLKKSENCRDQCECLSQTVGSTWLQVTQTTQ